MGILDYFRRVKTMTPGEGREMLASRRAGEVALLDVRWHFEYKRGHLPGARLIPLGELPERLGELDPEQPTIAYCGHGVRSHAAASIPSRAGFRQVWNMKGGIAAWDGEVTKEVSDDDRP